MENHDANLRPLRLFVKLLNGKTATLNFTTPHAYGYEIKQRIHEVTKIPSHLQRLIYSGRQLKDRTIISNDHVTFHLVLSLLGGKGGFGSLLRGAATKAGQKKTNNFDACRDMSGRRLRHVNAEKKLEEWKADEEERRLEKIAEDFIKKAAKKGNKGVGDVEVAKYVEKYREESSECVAKVEEAVRQACGIGKRKAVKDATAEAKRLKIWMGKRKLGESDPEDSSEDDDDDENDKSIVLNTQNPLDPIKANEGSSGSVTGGGVSCESGSEEEKEILVPKSLESVGWSGGGDASFQENGMVEPEIHEEMVAQSRSLEPALITVTEPAPAEKLENCGGFVSKSAEEIIGQTENVTCPENEEDSKNRSVGAEPNSSPDSKSAISEEAMAANTNAGELEKQLNFDEFNSAAEMEVLGMERLKSELQSHGLKCGGTLQERAARLFLLKSTPVEKLPKKLLAKK